jgi:ATP-binding cassette subfamily B protein
MKQDVTGITAVKYIIKMLKPLPIFLMLCVAMLWAIDVSFAPYLIKIMLNYLSEAPSEDLFVYLAVPASLYLSRSIIISTFFRLYDYFVATKMIPSLRKTIAQDAFAKLMEKGHRYYQNNFSGSLANKVNDLTSNIPSILQITIDRFFSHFLALAIAVYTLSLVHINFAISMLCWLMVFISSAIFFSKRLTKFSDDLSESNSLITGKLVDAFSNMLSIRLFSNKHYEKKLIGDNFQEAVVLEEKLEFSYFKMWLLYGYSFCILQGFNLYFLIQGRQEGNISIGDFVVVLGISNTIVDCMWQLAKEFSNFSRFLGKIIQALKAILSPLEMINQSDNSFKVSKGEIVFDKVKFHYKNDAPLFEDKSITIKPGQKVGLVGYSGSGKTTFANLILRIYDVSSGKVLIDGQDIAKIDQDSLRASIGMIPQDPSLFHRSIMENIRYSKIDATDEEVIEAAKKAHAHDFIIKISEGYDAMVGERGVKISGGQRQRIAIARAILKNAPILILDEATSQLDSLTESYIQESLWKLMQDKTTIIVAHRLSTLLNMDRILVFDKGKIIEDGSHQELLDKKGLYAELWSSQVGGFLPEKSHE